MYKFLAKRLIRKFNLWLVVSNTIFIADVKGHSMAEDFNSWKDTYKYLKKMK